MRQEKQLSSQIKLSSNNKKLRRHLSQCYAKRGRVVDLSFILLFLFFDEIEKVTHVNRIYWFSFEQRCVFTEVNDFFPASSKLLA